MNPRKEIEALELYEQGWTVEQIRTHLRASAQAVQDLIADACEPDCTRAPEMDFSSDVTDYLRQEVAYYSVDYRAMNHRFDRK